MKKKLLLLSLLATSLSASAQFNWLSNGDFETAGKTLETVTSAATPAKGDWAVYLKDGKTGFSGSLKADAAAHGKVVEIAVEKTNPSWYEAYLLQNVQYPLKPEKYKLVFDAKCTSGTSLNVSAWVYIDNGNLYALKTDFKDGMGTDAPSAASGARYDFNATGDWQTFTADYDFAWQCNNINAPKSTAAWAKAATTEAQLANCRLAFNTNKKVGTILIDNVKLIPVNPETKPDGADPEPGTDPEPGVDPDPAFPPYVEVPNEGALLQNNGFDVESIQTWRTKDEAKFLGYTGTWYFYAEPKKDVPTDASTAEIKVSEDSHGKVAALTNGATIGDWWGHTLLQRLCAKVNPVTYRLGFYARSASGATGKVNIALKPKEGTKVAGYALFEGFIPEDHPKSTGTTLAFSATTEWQYFEQVFDLSKMANTIWSIGTSDKILSVDNEELLKNVYLCFWNDKASSTLEIDDVSLELMETHTTIRNAGFEENTALPIKLGTDVSLGAHSGQWVLVNTNGKMDVSISDEHHTGTKSMKLDIAEHGKYARTQQYLVMDLYEQEPADYIFKFAAKSSQAEAPIRIDVAVYSDMTTFQEVTGDNGDTYVAGSTNSSNGLKIFKATTDWAEYSQKVKVEENAMVRLVIRPNITSLGAGGVSELALPLTYWFDDFVFAKDSEVNIKANRASEDVRVYVTDGSVQMAGLENASVTIYNLNGSLVDRIDHANGTVSRSLLQGAYIVKIASENGLQTVKVLVK